MVLSTGYDELVAGSFTLHSYKQLCCLRTEAEHTMLDLAGLDLAPVIRSQGCQLLVIPAARQLRMKILLQKVKTLRFLSWPCRHLFLSRAPARTE